MFLSSRVSISALRFRRNVHIKSVPKLNDGLLFDYRHNLMLLDINTALTSFCVHHILILGHESVISFLINNVIKHNRTSIRS